MVFILHFKVNLGTVALRMGSLKERERAQGPLVHPVSAQGLSLASQLMMQVTLLFCLHSDSGTAA